MEKENKIKNFFKGFNLYDKIFLPTALIAIIVVSIVFKCDALSIIYSIVGILAVFCLSKGFFFAPIVLIAMYALYAAQSYLQGLYGEMIVSLVIVVPLQAYAFIYWIVKKRKGAQLADKMIMRRLCWKEWVSIAAAVVAVMTGAYFMLKAFNTKFLLLSTASLAISLVANYLTMRGSKFQFIAYIIVNLICLAMWILPLASGQTNGSNFVPIAVSMVAYLVNNIYGFTNWLKLEKAQKQNIEEEKK